jgi:hypothetical protein
MLRGIAAIEIPSRDVPARGVTAGTTASTRDSRQRVRGDEQSEDWRAQARLRGLHLPWLDALRAVFDLDVRRCAMARVGYAVDKPGAEDFGPGASLRGEPAAGHARSDAPVPAAASARARGANSAGRDAQCESPSNWLSVRSSSATSCPAVHALPPSSVGTSRGVASLSSCRSLCDPSSRSFRAASTASTSPPQESR